LVPVPVNQSVWYYAAKESPNGKKKYLQVNKYVLHNPNESIAWLYYFNRGHCIKTNGLDNQFKTLRIFPDKSDPFILIKLSKLE
jgi:hypothetical protein